MLDVRLLMGEKELDNREVVGAYLPDEGPAAAWAEWVLTLSFPNPTF